DGPFVVAGTHVRIPHAGISRAVVNEVEFGIVGNPTPDRAAAPLPLACSPRGNAEIFALIFCVKRFEIGTDTGVLVGAAVVGTPQNLAGLYVKRRKLAANAEFASAIADEHNVLDYDRRHGDRLAELNIADLRLPSRLARIRVNGDGMCVKRVVNDLAVRERCSAI